MKIKAVVVLILYFQLLSISQTHSQHAMLENVMSRNPFICCVDDFVYEDLTMYVCIVYILGILVCRNLCVEIWSAE